MIYTRACRLLACDFAIVANCERLVRALDGILQSARQDYPLRRHHRFAVMLRDDAYAIAQDGEVPEIRHDAEEAAERLIQRMQECALAALPDYTRVHAGCADWAGKRVLAVGPRGSGKTTLMLRLLCEGFAVQADELVLVRAGEALPFPRRFRIKSPTWDLVPQLGPRRAARGESMLATGGIDFFDPSDVGFEWCIKPGRVDAVFFIEANHGGPTRSVRCPKYLMAQRVMSQSQSPEAGRSEWIRQMCTTLSGADCYSLALGDLDTAVTAVRTALVGSAGTA